MICQRIFRSERNWDIEIYRHICGRHILHIVIFLLQLGLIRCAVWFVSASLSTPSHFIVIWNKNRIDSSGKRRASAKVKLSFLNLHIEIKLGQFFSPAVDLQFYIEKIENKAQLHFVTYLKLASPKPLA